MGRRGLRDHTATVSRHCQQGILDFPILRGLPKYIGRAHSVLLGCAIARYAAARPQASSGVRPQRGHRATQTTSITTARSKVNRRLDKHGNLTRNSWRERHFRGIFLRERTNWIGSAGGWIFASGGPAADHTTANCRRLREYFNKNGDSAGIGLIASVFSANKQWGTVFSFQFLVFSFQFSVFSKSRRVRAATQIGV